MLILLDEKVCGQHNGNPRYAGAGLRCRCRQHGPIQYDYSEVKHRSRFRSTELEIGNHLGYRQAKGPKTKAEEISEIYAGLQQSYLTDFDVLLSGYAPSAEAVQAVGAIARDLKLQASTKAGSFFWGWSSFQAVWFRQGKG